MKRIYNLLALLMLAFSVSNASTYLNPGEVKTSYSNGDEVLIYSTSADEYLAGVTKTNTISDANIFTLVEGTDGRFKLLQKSTGRYVRVLSTALSGGLSMSSNGTDFAFEPATEETCTRSWTNATDAEPKVAFEDVTLLVVDHPDVDARDTIPSLYSFGYWPGTS